MSVDDEEEAPHALNLAERIRRLANGRTTLDVAQFQFIGLAEVRERYGDRWPQRRERINRVARNFISKRLAHYDVLIPGADGFLLVFGDRTGAKADEAALRITNELNAFFIGTDNDGLQFSSRRSEMHIDDLAQAFGALLMEAEAAARELAPAPEQAKPLSVQVPEAADLNLQTQPMWDARREALSTSFLVPLDARTGNPVVGYRFESHAESSRSRIDLDEQVLRTSEIAMRRLFGAGQRAIVGVTLHVASLNNMDNLTRLFTAMSKFDKHLMRYRVIRVTGIEPGYPRIYLEDIVRMLKSRTPSVGLAVHWCEPDIASLLRLQPASIGFALPPGAMWRGGPVADVFTRIRNAAETAHTAGVPVFVDGDIALDQAARFVNDGVNLLSSPAIWPSSPGLVAAQAWPASRLGPPPAPLAQAPAPARPAENSADADVDSLLI